MLEQLNRLIETAQRPTVVLQIIPVSTGAHTGLNAGGFALADFDDLPTIGYQEGPVRGQPVRDDKDVSALDLLWDTLTGEALPRKASLALLEEVAKTWTSPR